MSKPRHELMKEFSDKMEELYNMAEGLRDRADGHDKDIFNQTRGALYNLRDKAREQYYKWRPEVTVILMLILSLGASAQIITFDCLKCNPDFADKVVSTKAHLTRALSQTGFHDSDSITVCFHYPHEYEVVRHNVQEPERIDILYKQMVAHALLLKNILQYSRIDRFRLYLRESKDRYLYSDFADLSLVAERKRIKDREFGF